MFLTIKCLEWNEIIQKWKTVNFDEELLTSSTQWHLLSSVTNTSQLWADTVTSDCYLNTGYHFFCSQTNNYLSQVTRLTIFTVNVKWRAAARTTAVAWLVHRTAVHVLRLSCRSFSCNQPANTLNAVLVGWYIYIVRAQFVPILTTHTNP